MTFLFPEYLWGLFLLLIPVIIHFLNFRRYKKQEFTNINLLKEIQLEKRKRSRIRQWLILISRMLVMASLVFAFAQAVWDADDTLPITGTESVRTLYLDNSFSMMAGIDNNSHFLQAKAAASEIIKNSPETGKWILLVNDLPSKLNRLLDKESVLRELNQAKISPVQNTLEQLMVRRKDILDASEQEAGPIMVFSDFQQNTFHLNQWQADSNAVWYLVRYASPSVRNIYIDTVSVEAPMQIKGQQVQLELRLAAYASEDLEDIPLKLFVNGVQRASALIDIPQGEAAKHKLVFTIREAGFQEVILSLEDHPITFDDKWYLAFPVRSELPVLVISESEQPNFRALYKNDSLLRYSWLSPYRMQYDQLSTFKLIILNQMDDYLGGMADELSQYMQAGGNVLFLPSDDLQVNNQYLRDFTNAQFLPADTMDLRVWRIDNRHPLLDDVFETLPENPDYPFVYTHFPFDPSWPQYATNLISLENGDPFLLEFTSGRGRCYVASSGLDEAQSSWGRHALFVPVFYRMAMMSGFNNPPFYVFGKDEMMDFPAYQTYEKPYTLVSHGEQIPIIPEQEYRANRFVMRFPNEFTRAGSYSLYAPDSADHHLIAMNYDRSESKAPFVSSDSLTKWAASQKDAKIFLLENPTQASGVQEINNLSTGTSLWRLFVILALIFIFIEILLIRFWK